MINRGSPAASALTWVIGVMLLGIFLLGLFKVFAPFLEGLVWGIILVLMTWPIYRWLLLKCRLPEVFAALIMSVGFGTILFAFTVVVFSELGKELYSISKETSLGSGILANQFLSNPKIDHAIQTFHLYELSAMFFKTLGDISLKITGKATNILLGSLFNIGMMIFSSYFFYLNGMRLLQEIQRVLEHFSILNWSRIFSLTGNTIKGVVYGAFATSLAQGILAGVGYYVSGAPIPAVLGLSTALMSFVPFGAPFVYLPVSLYLIVVNGDWIAGGGMLVWGVLVVSTIDNILRPLFISHSMNLPLLLVFLGVVGGILAFGLIGLFIGPVLVALTQAAWHELVESVDRDNCAKKTSDVA